jgi:Flp pilus assembly protein TadD
MPPWLPEPGYGSFLGERRLTPEQRDLLRRWVDEGAVEGNPADLPAAPSNLGGWQLGIPDLVVGLPKAYTLPAESTDVWRNFVVPVPLTASRHVRTVELRPGNAKYVHHAQMAVDDLRTSRRRDQGDGQPGFEGMDMGDANMPDGSLIGWTPGMHPFPGVKGAAWKLPAGSDLILQLHMLPSGKPEIIEPSIGLYFATESESRTPLYVLMLDADDRLDIPPGVSDFVLEDRFELPVPVRLHAVYPHAHFLGKSLVATATLPGGSTRPLLRINRWNFKWQDVYRLVEAMPLPKGTSVHMRWVYDNSDGNAAQQHHPPVRIRAGNRSSDEMAHLQLQVELQSHAERLQLQEAHFRYLLSKDPRNERVLYGLGGALKDQGRLPEAADLYRRALTVSPNHVSAHINLGAVLLQTGRLAEAVDHLRTAVRLDSNASGAHYHLGIVFASQGNLGQATEHYREAIRARPDYGEAHNNLGQIYRATRRLDEAVRHLRQAAEFLPDFADVHNNLGESLRLQGQTQEAIEHFRRAVAIDANHGEARKNLGLVVGR